jgi:hypothetical protein
MSCSIGTRDLPVDTTQPTGRGPAQARPSCRNLIDRTRSVVKNHVMLVATLCVVACRGSGTKDPEIAEPTVQDEPGERVEPTEDMMEEEEPPPPPPPQHFSARAELAPLKGVKMSPTAVMFFQTEGEHTQVQAESPFDGLKAGTYHLVIHEGDECGKNAATVGPEWELSSGIALKIVATKKAAATLAESTVDLMLYGEDTVVGRTLVLHADKRGAAGKAVACGPITSADEEVPED